MEEHLTVEQKVVNIRNEWEKLDAETQRRYFIFGFPHEKKALFEIGDRFGHTSGLPQYLDKEEEIQLYAGYPYHIMMILLQKQQNKSNGKD